MIVSADKDGRRWSDHGRFELRDQAAGAAEQQAARNAREDARLVGAREARVPEIAEGHGPEEVRNLGTGSHERETVGAR